MKEPGKGELAQLFISIIGKEVTIEETSEISGLEIERIAELISSQDSLKFFNKKAIDHCDNICMIIHFL